MKRFSAFISIIFLAILLASCAGHGLPHLSSQATQIQPPEAGWQTIPPRDVYSARLNKMLKRIEIIMAANTVAKQPEEKKVPVVETLAIMAPIAPIVETVTTVVPIGETSKRLNALEKRMSVVEKKATANSKAIQSTTMRVAELEILSDVSSQYMACVVGNFDIGQSDITEELGCKIVNKCPPYFKKEAKEKGGDDYQIAYIFGYGDIGGRADLTKALSNARAENTMNFLMNNACVGSKTTTAKIVEGGPTKMFGKADYNRCVVVVAQLVYHSTAQTPVVLPQAKPKSNP